MVGKLRVEIDRNICVGAGTCETLEPEIFQVGPDGIAFLLRDEADADVMRGVAASCPSGAIKVVEAE